MQTFLPYADFSRSANCLDDKRLGNQRVEALVILNTVEGRNAKTGWRRHPAVRMWGGFGMALRLYLNACLDAWEQRGFQNNMPREEIDPAQLVRPWWLGWEPFHASHRASLLRKNPEYYSRHGWCEDPRTPYWWPTKNLQEQPDSTRLNACRIPGPG